jgi:hypothetical protein
MVCTQHTKKIRIDISRHPHAFVTRKLVGHRKKPKATSMSTERPISYHDVMSSITGIRCTKKKYKSQHVGAIRAYLVKGRDGGLEGGE